MVEEQGAEQDCMGRYSTAPGSATYHDGSWVRELLVLPNGALDEKCRDPLGLLSAPPFAGAHPPCLGGVFPRDPTQTLRREVCSGPGTRGLGVAPPVPPLQPHAALPDL